MAITISAGDTLIYAQTMLKNQRLFVNGLQPGTTILNITLQRMLGSPFIWRFNRASTSIAISLAGGQDYTVSLPKLGRIEAQWLVDGTGKIWEMQGKVELPKVSMQKRPQQVAPVYDDNAGNITFRVDSVPDVAYTLFLDYQQKAPLLTSGASTFGPVPDEFEYLFAKGVLAEASLLVNDARFTIWQRDFVAGLLATQDGLDAQAKNIFLEQMIGFGNTATRAMARTGDGGKARTVAG